MTRVRLVTGTVALYVDLEREHARSAASAVAAAARDAGFVVALCDEQDAALRFAVPGARVEEAKLLVTVGGDGTLLRAAQVAAPHEIPLFGVNTGRLGFLTEIDGGAGLVPALTALLRDGFTLDSRIALYAEVHGRKHFALNDVVVRRAAPRMAVFGLDVDGKEAAHVPADGIAVATPTGSTAYFLSAGGPIMAPDVAAFGITALLPHTLFTRPLVVPDTSVVVVTSIGAEAFVEADGRIVEELKPGDRVTVTRYPRMVRFARRAPLNFFSLLEEKMRWNAPIKERRE
jgi:NAD+ kinase